MVATAGRHSGARIVCIRDGLIFLAFVTWQAGASLGIAQQPTDPAEWIESGGLRCRIDRHTGLPDRIESHAGSNERVWLDGPLGFELRNEATSAAANAIVEPHSSIQAGETAVTGTLAPLGLAVTQRWSPITDGLVWEFTFAGAGPRAGHTLTLDLPVLSAGCRIFTPSESGVMEVDGFPTYQATPYGNLGWESGAAYVLPLVSVLDFTADQGLTLALPPDEPIPHLQVEWRDSRVLRLTLGHRAMGAGQPAVLKLLLFSHPADYRSALRVYSDRYPAYFRSPLPRGPFEGAFWYHHIQDHPDFAEMARQNIRYIWSSFWFTYLGEYLPDEAEWHPYTYAKWWKLGQTMNDEKIRAFTNSMHEHGIGTYAYFNVTEYGGYGGKLGDADTANRALRERFADALMKNERGEAIPTWEGAMAMNPGRRYALWPFLQDQVRRHLSRLPELDGFIIDRLDWASRYDYGHDDGVTMLGERPVENMAGPVAEAVQEVCRLSHAAQKRVFVNQFWRVEVLRDVDGYCHESDYLPALKYLSPYRPASAWHQRQSYDADLLAFEAQLKARLQAALFPQMIAHEFPISQQAPNQRAADLLEDYAPLFAPLMGKEQALLPHCVTVSGPNDVNLFVNGRGHYVAPVTSRLCFLSRAGWGAEGGVTLDLRVPDADQLKWAHVYSAESAPRRAQVTPGGSGVARVTLESHQTASVVEVGRGDEPELKASAPTPFQRELTQRSSAPRKRHSVPANIGDGTFLLRVLGANVGAKGKIDVSLGELRVGKMYSDRTVFPVPPIPGGVSNAAVSLRSWDEGTWFIPEHVQLLQPNAGGHGGRLVAEWLQPDGAKPESSVRELILPLQAQSAEVPFSTARFSQRDAESGGQWPGRFGQTAAWLAGITDEKIAQSGFELKTRETQRFAWKEASDDARVPSPSGKPAIRADGPPAGATAPATAPSASRAACWFAPQAFDLAIQPPNDKPYRLTLYLLDFDRNGRAQQVELADEIWGPLDAQQVSTDETARGIYLTWTVTGPVVAEVRKLAGYNAVASAVFIDPGK
jgi:hypothetical protein